jgi:hypothetical protein
MQERVVYEMTWVSLTALGHLNYASSQQFAGTARSGFHGVSCGSMSTWLPTFKIYRRL